MRTVASDGHRSHHSIELDRGRLVPSWEGPERADRVRAAVADADLGPIVEPEPLDRELLGRVHDPVYVEFLEGAWDRWVTEGYEAPGAMGIAWPGRRTGRRRPDDLLGQLGYHSFAADCSIVAGTWAAAASSAAVAQTAAQYVADGERTAFALCRPPGHHAMSDQFGGYCYLNNAAVAAQLLVEGGADRVAILDLDPDNVDAYQSLAVLYAKANDPARSEQYLARAVELAPADAPTIYLQMAGGLLGEKNPDAAKVDRGVELIR